VEVRFGQEIPVVKGFDVAPFLKSGKASHDKPAIESEVVQALEERFIAARAEVEQLRAELAEALDRPSADEELAALRAELEGVTGAFGNAQRALHDAEQELTATRQELDDAKAMIAALTDPVAPITLVTVPVVPEIPTEGAGLKKGGK
jgi:chromosome segregation ATPase